MITGELVHDEPNLMGMSQVVEDLRREFGAFGRLANDAPLLAGLLPPSE
jgi:tetrahydromethanopterin S-methyltransferase subunit F